MAVRPILQLGNPLLYERCRPADEMECPEMATVADDLYDTLVDFRKEHGAGRAIAAPQIGVLKRLVFMLIDEPALLINPVIDAESEETVELWDDCMSFPDLLVRVRRHVRCRITFRDLQWRQHWMYLDGDLSELLQHECDHLDGILAVSRAVDGRAFSYRRHLPQEERDAYFTRISRGIRV